MQYVLVIFFLDTQQVLEHQKASTQDASQSVSSSKSVCTASIQSCDEQLKTSHTQDHFLTFKYMGTHSDQVCP